MLQSQYLKNLIALRHDLHSHPEVSGEEAETRDRVSAYLKKVSPGVELQEVGKGLIATYKGSTEGPTTMIRAELDALPIQEVNEIPYRSTRAGVSHKCGHDGHMCMVAGLAHLLAEVPPEKGTIVLLFQSAEETGQGAQWTLDEQAFQTIKPDYAFSLHNLPGLPMHQITCRAGTFCAASTGIRIKLYGKTAHASSPETGISPAIAISQLATSLDSMVDSHAFDDFTLLTITHLQVGEPSFGISPGEGELRVTIRAYQNSDLDKLKELIESRVSEVSQSERLTFDISYHEPFTATTNHQQAVSMIEKVASQSGMTFSKMPKSNPWSEDFGLFLQQCQGAMFGLGSGIDQPALHNPDYDFPDDLIETGITMFWGLIQELNY
ncbi:MAG: amidohydrolase [Roseivirga sp.]|nr:amidohydrolase [Roseivirga sp.]